MWMVRWFFIVVIIIFISVFISKNMGLTPVNIDFIFAETGEISPLMAMFFAFVSGFLTWFVISIFNFFKMRSELSAKDKVIKNLKEELNDYRNESLSMEDADKTVLMKKESASASVQPPFTGA
ncbi:MAG: LapA family protein [Fibrobacterota bacterium]